MKEVTKKGIGAKVTRGAGFLACQQPGEAAPRAAFASMRRKMPLSPIPIGFYPFWFWNDTLSPDKIRWQIQEMADKGVRGFFIPTDEDLKAYEAILWLLMESHLDFHIVDTDILQEGQIEGGCIRVADIVAKLVVVPPMRVIEEPLRDWLERYEAAGGMVIYCSQNFQPEALVEELLRTVQPSLSVRVSGAEAGEVLVVKRTGEDRTLWFALNTSGETITAEFSSGGELREIPLDDDLPQTLKVSETFRVSAFQVADLLATC